MLRKKRILIIDDEKDFVGLTKLNLEATGHYKVRAEVEGKNAIKAASEFKPDLILLDIAMPEVDGTEVMRQLSKQDRFSNIPVVFLTAIVTDQEVHSHDNVIGGHSFIAKPIDMDTLINKIETYLKK